MVCAPRTLFVPSVSKIHTPAEARSVRRAVIVLACTVLVLPGCRSLPQTAPSDAPDLTGEVVDVQMVSGLPGLDVRSSAPAASDRSIRLLRVLVSGSRGAVPGSYASIGVDGTTMLRQESRRSRPGDGDGLVGSFVRVWYRGLPRSSSPTTTIAMARVVAVDTVSVRASGRQASNR